MVKRERNRTGAGTQDWGVGQLGHRLLRHARHGFVWRAGVFGLLLAACALVAPVRLGVVVGESMMPTMQNGSLYLFDRRPQARQSIQRGDVVVFDYQGKTYIKRVLAVPNDSLYMMRYADGQADELILRWLVGRMKRAIHRRALDPGMRLVEQRVPPGHLFVVGDYLERSTDSRAFGAIPLSAVRGKVLNAPTRDEMLYEFAIRFHGTRKSENI